MATTVHWRPNFRAISARSFRSRDGRGVGRDLVSAGLKQGSGVVNRPDAATHGQRNAQVLAHRCHGVAGVVPALRRCRHVKHDDLVGTLLFVGRGQLHRVASVLQPLETDALDNAPGVDIEAGDDPSGQHGMASQRRISAAPQEPESSG